MVGMHVCSAHHMATPTSVSGTSRGSSGSSLPTLPTAPDVFGAERVGLHERPHEQQLDRAAASHVRELNIGHEAPLSVMVTGDIINRVLNDAGLAAPAQGPNATVRHAATP
jgi:hypothetical protein